MKEARENDEKHHIVSERLNAIAPGLPAVFKIATSPKPLSEPRTVKFLAEESKYPLCRKLASTLGTTSSIYLYTCNGFLNLVASIDGVLQRVVS